MTSLCTLKPFTEMAVILLMQNTAAHLNLFFFFFSFLAEGLVISLLCTGFYFIPDVVFVLFP